MPSVVLGAPLFWGFFRINGYGVITVGFPTRESGHEVFLHDETLDVGLDIIFLFHGFVFVDSPYLSSR